MLKAASARKVGDTARPLLLAARAEPLATWLGVSASGSRASLSARLLCGLGFERLRLGGGFFLLPLLLSAFRCRNLVCDKNHVPLNIHEP